jgi:hypothetical protein
MGQRMDRSMFYYPRHYFEVSGQLHAWEIGPGDHCKGGWIGPGTRLDDLEKKKFLTLPGLELRPLCRSVRSQSLYRRR